jgi:deoxycytidylate deaminase
MIITSGLTKIFYREGYQDQLAEDLLKEAGIETKKL